ncbi:MAG: HNH endonuclease [Flavipsychrobacter sp.]|nr:HNH endonuclease [Flavipsychrobacter sp.]
MEDFEKMEVFTFQGLQNDMAIFLEKYAVETHVLCPNKQFPKHTLTDRDKRTCRFCGTKNDSKKFKTKSHVIPHLLGNRYLISDVECDSCNSFFGKYENDLAFFLGIHRTMQGIKGKENVPKFNSPNDSVTAKVNNDFYGVKSTEIEMKDPLNKGFSVDMNSGIAQFKYTKQSYTPLHVYKVLLKIALSFINENDVSNYKLAYNFLVTSTLNEKIAPSAKVLYYRLSSNYKAERPFIYLFRKKDPKEKIPTHSFAIYFENILFTFHIPLLSKDIENGLDKGSSDIYYCPPMLGQIPFEGSYERRMIDLSSEIILKNEQEVLSFAMDPQSLKNIKAYNPITEELSDRTFSADGIVKIVLTEHSSQLRIPIKKTL